MANREIKELFEKQKTTKATAPDGTPLYYNGPLILDGNVQVTKKMEQAFFDRKLKTIKN